MDYFDNLYTIIELAIHNNIEKERFNILYKCLKDKDTQKMQEKFPELSKFIPYCNWYNIQGKDMLCISAYYYDLYRETGLLPNLENFDINPDTEKLEHWMYINPIFFEMNPNTDFEFASRIYDCDVWNLFLSGCARMDYYEGKNIKLEQRIKYAIVEYMMKRPQFFTTEDFVDNPILHKKYGGNKNEEKLEG